jgi:hypothetical protein
MMPTMVSANRTVRCAPAATDPPVSFTTVTTTANMPNAAAARMPSSRTMGNTMSATEMSVGHAAQLPSMSVKYPMSHDAHATLPLRYPTPHDAASASGE